ncbi:hypothetical protein CHARACLAT_001604 [Characodon lateralis]|uniref:Uncharacterized protein n=1 Tax=Characodon lateralis TaxID=208331 RepID=A0ABU7D5L1_9TELE|nr:hypothetical protein [Characodon lateralis]
MPLLKLSRSCALHPHSCSYWRNPLEIPSTNLLAVLLVVFLISTHLNAQQLNLILAYLSTVRYSVVYTPLSERKRTKRHHHQTTVHHHQPNSAYLALPTCPWIPSLTANIKDSSLSVSSLFIISWSSQ